MTPTKKNISVRAMLPATGSVTNHTRQQVRDQLIEKMDLDPTSKTDAMMVEHMVTVITKDVSFQLN